MRSLVLAVAWLASVGAKATVGGKDGLQVEVTLEARCKENQKAEKEDKVTVHYGGFLKDGELSSLAA